MMEKLCKKKYWSQKKNWVILILKIRKTIDINKKQVNWFWYYVFDCWFIDRYKQHNNWFE